MPQILHYLSNIPRQFDFYVHINISLMYVVYLHCIQIKNNERKRKMTKDIEINVFLYLDFKVHDIFPARFAFS